MSEPRRPTIVLDFDGVIHRYSHGWQGGDLYDGATDGCRAALERLHELGRLVVCTARGGQEWVETKVDTLRDPDEWTAIWAWLKVHHLDDLIAEVTSIKPMGAVYIDDRAIHYEPGNWGAVVREAERRLNAPHKPLGRAFIVRMVRLAEDGYTVPKGSIGAIGRDMGEDYVWVNWTGSLSTGPIDTAHLEQLGELLVEIPT